MQDIFIILVILLILFFAARPLYIFKKQKGSCYSCYGCNHNINGKCSIKNVPIEDIKKAIHHTK